MRLLGFGIAAFVFASFACSVDEKESPVLTPRVTELSAPTATPCFRGDPACMPNSSDSGPQLSPEDQTRATDIAVNHPLVLQLLDGAEYEISGVGPMVVHDEIIGGVVTFVPNAPLAIDHDLPYMDTGVRGGEGNETQIPLPPPYYLEGTAHITIDAMGLYVGIDLNRDRVVEILPVPFSPITD